MFDWCNEQKNKKTKQEMKQENRGVGAGDGALKKTDGERWRFSHQTWRVGTMCAHVARGGGNGRRGGGEQRCLLD